MSDIGYARVSTLDQHANVQTEALRAYGCERVFVETVSGAARQRPQLTAALDYARRGDRLVVVRLDRLGRSLRDLLGLIEGLQQSGVQLVSLAEHIDTSSPSGRLVLHVFACIAEFERELIRERTRAGLAAARAAGRVGGRRPVVDERRAVLVAQMHADGVPIAAIARTLAVSRTSVYRALARAA